MLLPVQVGLEDQVDELRSDSHQEVGILEAARVGDKIAVFVLSGWFCPKVFEASSQQEIPKVATLQD